ncbi:hypothetical protein [Bacillus sp. JJ722]|uniref:hypothetical protein n=1 Tax=Bacillus sp. JJ722 TaxID=3122973 RepID=UPI002FFDB5E3
MMIWEEEHEIIGIVAFLAEILISLSYFMYYTYKQNKIEFKQIEGFSITTKTKNMTLVGVK